MHLNYNFVALFLIFTGSGIIIRQLKKNARFNRTYSILKYRFIYQRIDIRTGFFLAETGLALFLRIYIFESVLYSIIAALIIGGIVEIVTQIILKKKNG